MPRDGTAALVRGAGAFEDCVPFFEGFFQFVGGYFFAALAEVYYVALAFGFQFGDLEDVGNGVYGDVDDSVEVGCHEVAGVDGDSTDVNRLIDEFCVDVGVRDEHFLGPEWEANRFSFVEVTDAAVGDGSDRSERFGDVALDLAPVRAGGVGVVTVVDDDEAWGRDCEDAFPVVAPGCWVAGLAGCGHGQCDGISDGGWLLGVNGADFRAHVALGPCSDGQSLQAV